MIGRQTPAKEKALRAAIEARFGEELARQPIRALANVAQIDESRILMAPSPDRPVDGVS